MAERNYIKSSKIQSIEKIEFQLNSDKQLRGSKKLSTQRFDKHGFLIETIIYNPDNSIQYTYKYKYNVTGKRIETIRFNHNGNPEKKYTYEYNNYGNKVRANQYNMEDSLKIIIYTTMMTQAIL